MLSSDRWLGARWDEWWRQEERKKKKSISRILFLWIVWYFFTRFKPLMIIQMKEFVKRKKSLPGWAAGNWSLCVFSPPRSALGSLCSCFTVPSSSRWRRDPSTPSQEKPATPSARTSSSGNRLTTKHWSVNPPLREAYVCLALVRITAQLAKL